MTQFDADDTGLSESPIYSNFVKHLWKSHARHGLAQSPNRSHENTGGIGKSSQIKQQLISPKPEPALLNQASEN